MAQIIASIDQGSVNELFVRTYNAWPPIPLSPMTISQGIGSGSFSLRLDLSIDSQASPRPLPSNAQPIDLLAAGANPPIAYSGLGWRVHSNVHGSLRLGAVSAALGLSFDTDVTLSGSAQASAPHVGNAFQARVQLTVGDFTLSFAGNRNAVVDAARNAASNIDVSPFPGTQHLPPAAINAVGDAAGQLFDQLAPRAADAIKQLIRARLGALQLQLTSNVPDSYSIQIPGTSQALTLHVQALQIGVGGERITLTVTFA
jgi:hypothetical protein